MTKNNLPTRPPAFRRAGLPETVENRHMPLVRLRAFVALGLAIAGLSGCRPADDIRAYDAPKAVAPPAPAEAEVKVRLLGAMIPTAADSTACWFVKLVGPIAAINAVEKDFDAFVGSLTPTADPNVPLSWTVPAGWTADTSNPNRIVTLAGGPPNAPLQMYLSLPFGGSVASNVNRWRTLDLGLKNSPESEARKQATDTKVGTLTVHRVDLKGPGSAKKGGPFMGG